jgi:soluble lytic murein transglycosylase-like protein
MAKKPAAKKRAPRIFLQNGLPPNALLALRRGLWLGTEIVALSAAGLVAVIVLLGRAGANFGGSDLWSSLLPFAGAVLLLSALGFPLLRGWLRLRAELARRGAHWPLAAALTIAGGAAWFATGAEFKRDLGHLRALVGGAKEAETAALSHQVYAAYRRADLAGMKRILERAIAYDAVVKEAAALYALDPDLLVGLGAAESSFLPRESKDGGVGLFQITQPPKAVLEEVGKRLGKTPNPLNRRHNALLASATLRHYLGQMQDDLFLGLLAYNIGPKNGGLLSIMQRYGAKDFATIQPYLQNLPRDYPIRVLNAALACRVWRAWGRLPRYEEGDNAKRIQALGIPGLRPPDQISLP